MSVLDNILEEKPAATPEQAPAEGDLGVLIVESLDNMGNAMEDTRYHLAELQKRVYNLEIVLNAILRQYPEIDKTVKKMLAVAASKIKQAESEGKTQ